MAVVISIRNLVNRLWRSDRALTAAALLMLGALVAFLAGLMLDSRIVTGAPVWLKPAKFALSTAIYMFTLAWIFSYLTEWPRVRRVVGQATAVILVAEVGVVAAQAARGTTSHFNLSTPFDAVLFSFMGAAIALQTVLSAVAAVAVWRQPFLNRALGWAFRLGLVITIGGALAGGLMTRPTDAQRADSALTRRMPIVGAHTVGAPDGGPGLPGTGWSIEHGDLRVPHFLGLHALQGLPAIAWLLRRRRVEDALRVRGVVVAGCSYGSLVLLLVWQALRGQALVDPDAVTLVVLGAWAVVSAAALAWLFRTRTRSTAGALNWINP